MTRAIRNGYSMGLAILGMALSAPASATLGNQGESKVVFKATGPAGLSFEGKSNMVSVKDNGGTIVFTAKLDTFATGIELRDRHMKEKYLETGKYPDAILEVEKGKIQFPAGNSVSSSADGKLTLHGVTHPVKVTYRADGDGKHAKVDGSMRVNMKDFKIDVPNYLGVTVKPNVDVDVKLGIVDK